MIEIPAFDTKKELFDFFVKNKERLIAQKKSVMKHADCFSCVTPKELIVSKSISTDKEDITVKVVINTTNLMDSHSDVHLPGLWSKSLQENKMIMHLQEHNMSFDKIIADSDELKAYTKSYTWKELGYSFSGKTEALIFDSNIKKERNPFMFKQYAFGYVKNHSVGMYYVKLILAINDEDYGAEYEAWEKYYPEIANKERADELGLFWAIREAKIVEGSAVPLGSNWATPTLDIKCQPPDGTDDEPPDGTRKIDINKLIKELKK
jgi:hypothetical protein